MKISAGNDKKRCSCECPEGRSFPHEGEVMPGIVPLGKLFFWLFLDVSTAQKTVLPESSRYIFASRARALLGGANHRVEEQTFDRAG